MGLYTYHNPYERMATAPARNEFVPLASEPQHEYHSAGSTRLTYDSSECTSTVAHEVPVQVLPTRMEFGRTIVASGEKVVARESQSMQSSFSTLP